MCIYICNETYRKRGHEFGRGTLGGGGQKEGVMTMTVALTYKGLKKN